MPSTPRAATRRTTSRAALGALCATVLLAAGGGAATAADYPVTADKVPAEIDCDHLYFAHRKSVSRLENDANGNATAINRVVARGDSVPQDWAGNLSVGTDPDAPGRAAIVSAQWNRHSATLYKVADGSANVTDQIFSGKSYSAPNVPGVTWGGYAMDSRRQLLWGGQNLTAAKNVFRLDLKTGRTEVQNVQPADPTDTVWKHGAFIPDFLVDHEGGIYAMSVRGGSYLYRIDTSGKEWKATRVVQVTGPVAGEGGNIYGMAWLRGSIYMGSGGKNLYRVDPRTGQSQLVGNVAAAGNQQGSVHPSDGGWLLDMASCDVTSDLTKTLKVSKSADRQAVEAGGRITYTVKVKNEGNSPNPQASFTDDLSTLGGAVYNDDATASAGSVSVDRETSRLTWNGSLQPGQEVTVTFSVTANDPEGDNVTLANTVTSTEDSNCGAGSEDPGCTSTVTVSRGIPLVSAEAVAPALGSLAAASALGAFLVRRRRQGAEL
ncbi:hypothetical protein ABZ078_01455 [Streptomyces sp. NPDC006385]|uniref:DUF7927 domain-containing protein n=1 Tax=Streptomyces sp. NPDC006385 TaxID=3156761 RepID=UPI0033B29410